MICYWAINRTDPQNLLSMTLDVPLQVPYSKMHCLRSIIVPIWSLIGTLSQLCHGPVVTYCMVYHYTKRATLARLLANKGPAIYVVHLNKYFVIPP